MGGAGLVVMVVVGVDVFSAEVRFEYGCCRKVTRNQDRFVCSRGFAWCRFEESLVEESPMKQVLHSPMV